MAAVEVAQGGGGAGGGDAHLMECLAVVDAAVILLNGAMKASGAPLMIDTPPRYAPYND